MQTTNEHLIYLYKSMCLAMPNDIEYGSEIRSILQKLGHNNVDYYLILRVPNDGDLGSRVRKNMLQL